MKLLSNCVLFLSVAAAGVSSGSTSLLARNGFARRSLSMSGVDALAVAKKQIQSNQVMIFSKSYCPFCTKAKDAFASNNIEFTAMELDEVDGGAEIQAELLKMTGQRTVPNIFIKEQHLGGCDDTMKALAEGRVQKMLE